jgi:hypothetical protein
MAVFSAFSCLLTRRYRAGGLRNPRVLANPAKPGVSSVRLLPLCSMLLFASAVYVAFCYVLWIA